MGGWGVVNCCIPVGHEQLAERGRWSGSAVSIVQLLKRKSLLSYCSCLYRWLCPASTDAQTTEHPGPRLRARVTVTIRRLQ